MAHGQFTARWTPEMDAVLVEEWLRGASTAEIAGELDVSRNAVAGRIARLRGNAQADGVTLLRRREPEEIVRSRVASRAVAKAAKAAAPQIKRPAHAPCVAIEEPPQPRREAPTPPPRPSRLCRDIGAFTPRVRTTARKTRPLPRQAVPAHAPRALDGGVPLVSLQAPMCRWPVTYTTEHLFCGCLKMRGSSYCAYHASIAVN